MRPLVWPLLFCASGILAAYMVQISCMIDGWIALLNSHSVPECGTLWRWVVAYCTVVASLPFWLGASFTILALLIGSAGFLREHVHKSCAAKVPELWYFVDEVQVKGLVAFASLCMSVLMHRYLRSRVARIQRVWGSNGPALEAVVTCILRDPQPEVSPDQECSICLGALDGEGAAEPAWRQLRCGHVFHEECLVEWLGRARHCPLCRHNLHMAYLE